MKTVAVFQCENMYWSNLSRHPHLVEKCERTEMKQTESIKMNHQYEKSIEPLSDQLVGSLVILDRWCYDEDEKFIIRCLENDQPIGYIVLSDIDWIEKKANLRITISRRECWGKGYGTDAVRVLMRYAFQVLGLGKVCWNVR
jgi:RimJ/RimL family protein N-acetyltransferase